MPINWDEFEQDLDSIIDTAEANTDERLASRISSVTRMTDDEVKELFPEPSDVKKVAELMKIVKSAESRNNKVTKLTSNAEQFAGVIVTLLDKFV